MIQKMKKQYLLGIAIVLFFILFKIGDWLAQRKPLWNDEVYTQIYTLDDKSYLDILRIRFLEGNSCPLFYIIQKAMCDLAQYRFPHEWHQEWLVSDLKSQRFLRIPSNIFMSFSLVLIFYFFSRYYSLGTGLYSFLVSLSSYMVWVYWVEARPYAIWFFLTTAQALIFLVMIKEKQKCSHLWPWLSVIHVLLSLTVIVSIAQITIVSFLLWFLKEKQWKKYIVLTAIPVGLCFFYYSQSPILAYWLRDPAQLLYYNFPRAWIIFFFVYGIMLFLREKTKILNSYSDKTKREGAGFFVFLALMLVASLALLGILKMRADPVNYLAVVDPRYFIYLTPIGIIAITLFSVDFMRAFKENRWMKINLVVGLGGMLVVCFLKTYSDLIALAVY